MKNWKKKISVLILGIAILASAPPAWPGGRDVPDRTSDAPGSQAKKSLPDGSWDCATAKITRLSLGGINMDMVYGSDGSVTIQPSLFTEAIRFINDLLIKDPPDSCPEP